MNAKIRHVAIWSDGRESSARFYETVFGMTFFTNQAAAEGDASNRSRGQLSDGIIGLALNPRPPGYRSGLDHFGIEVQELDKVRERIEEYYPDTLFTKALEGVAFAGWRITDPVGTHIDIAQEGGANLRGGYRREEHWEQPRHLHHIAIRAKKPAVLAEFYKKVFEVTEVKNLSGEGGICLTDGKSYLLIRPCENYSYRSMTQGIDHVGFQVEDLETVKKELDDIGRSFPESAARKIFVGRNGAFLQRDIDSCGLGQYAIADPEGVLIDLTT
jgi:catechol 2,3-dioxygenase-like lactoylglutathione lyase family enzyme